jgi:hypothetical protein
VEPYGLALSRAPSTEATAPPWFQRPDPLPLAEAPRVEGPAAGPAAAVLPQQAKASGKRTERVAARAEGAPNLACCV